MIDIRSDTVTKPSKEMLEVIVNSEDIIFKNHPAVDIKRFGKLSKSRKTAIRSNFSKFCTWQTKAIFWSS